jgi:ceramide glucosyltransferase
MAAAWQIGVRRLDDRILRNYLWLLPVRDLLGFAIWCSGLLGRNVEWRGKRFRIGKEGKIVQIE